MADLSQRIKDLGSYAQEKFEDMLAIAAARNKSVESQLPGRENGPADAYRHILWAAELTRRFGETAARAILETHEVYGSSSSMPEAERQHPNAGPMDRHNNEIGITIGKETKTFDEVVSRAQRVMDGSDRGGNGKSENANWLPDSEWRKNPIDDETGLEKPTLRTNWPNTDWVGGSVKEPYVYPYGGGERRAEPAPGETDRTRLPDETSKRKTPRDPLDAPVEAWSEEDRKKAMASDAYLKKDHPRHERAVARVRDWFEHAHPEEPTPITANSDPLRTVPRQGRESSRPPSVPRTRGEGQTTQKPRQQRRLNDLLARPASRWNEADRMEVMGSEAYLSRDHPEHERAVLRVRDWFERVYGKGPMRGEAAGRPLPARPARPFPKRNGES